MTENDINNLLLQTRRIADSVENKEVSANILRLGSLLFEQWAILTNHKNHKVYCGCKRQLRTGQEIEFFNNVSECIYCDHGRSEYDY